MNASHDLEQLARRMLADYDRHDPGTAFADGLSLSIDDAYRIQSLVAELREARGERVIGYKVGCTSPVIRRRLGAGHPVFGRLFESDCWTSGVNLPAERFTGLAIEGELAVRLACDLPAVEMPDADVAAAIHSVFPVIELHNLVFRRGDPSVEELVANNAIHAGFVSAKELTTKLDSEAATLRIEMDEAEIATVSGQALTQTIFDSLRWLSRELLRHGQGLQRGQTILCGSIADLFPVHPVSRIAVTTDRFGAVECAIVDNV
ncbi:MAG: hypothetical protein H8E66_07760 [Planctomycetes bacterium]|nr:hypothetical protein [Planctomycetota bacterium]